MKATSPDRRPVLRFGRFVLLALIAAGLTFGVFLLTLGQPAVARFSLATAYASLFFLAVALIIGPLNVLRAAPNPLSLNLRRDIGIIAGIWAIAHVIIGLQVHMGGDFVQYFFHRTRGEGIGGVRLDAFGFANHSGLIATLIILILLCISNNLSVRSLGPQQWKSTQRWNYAGALLVILHGLLYQVLEKRQLAFIACVLIVAGVTAAFQLLGFRRKREQAL